MLDLYIEYVVQHLPHSNEPPAHLNAYDGIAAKFGEFLRCFKFPFAEYQSSSPPPLDVRVNAKIERLYDARAGLIYIRLLAFLFLVTCMIWVTNNIRRPFNAISSAVDTLAGKHLDTAIKVNGPLDVQEVSAKLESLRKILRDNDQQRMLFLRHVSHEIKTPLASIKEGVTLLDDGSLGPINDDQQEVIEILVRASKELQQSIEDLLIYNSAVSAQVHQKRQRVDLVAMIEKTITKHRLSLQRNNIQIRKTLNPISTKVDPKQMETVFDNLLSNAIKYAPQNSEIRLWLRRSRDTAIEFTIRDQGPGVGKKHRHAIFDAFYMGDKSTSAIVKGTGLGLSLAKQYVEAHQGDIKLIETRTGATFRVTFNKATPYKSTRKKTRSKNKKPNKAASTPNTQLTPHQNKK